MTTKRKRTKKRIATRRNAMYAKMEVVGFRWCVANLAVISPIFLKLTFFTPPREDLICCSSCPKVFHSNCHKPKIHHVPEGEWNCMYCVKQKALSLKEEKRKRALSLKEKRKRSGSLIADLGPRKVICTVRFPAIECTACGENGGEQSFSTVQLPEHCVSIKLVYLYQPLAVCSPWIWYPVEHVAIFSI